MNTESKSSNSEFDFSVEALNSKIEDLKKENQRISDKLDLQNSKIATMTECFRFLRHNEVVDAAFVVGKIVVAMDMPDEWWSKRVSGKNELSVKDWVSVFSEISITSGDGSEEKTLVHTAFKTGVSDYLAARKERATKGIKSISKSSSEDLSWVEDEGRIGRFSFSWCCEFFGVDVDAARMRLTMLPASAGRTIKEVAKKLGIDL